VKIFSYFPPFLLPPCSIPPEMVRKVNALKNLQKASTKLEEEFYREVQLLEARYHKLYLPHYKKRAEIVSGAHQPTDEECRWSDGNAQENGGCLLGGVGRWDCRWVGVSTLGFR